MSGAVAPPPSLSFAELLSGGPFGPPDPREAEYLHWDKLRHLTPPEGLTATQWWARIKLSRSYRPLPLVDVEGNPFQFSVPDVVLRSLHRIDQQLSGAIGMDAQVTGDEQARKRYLVNAVMEEAIRSSQLEGAATTRAAAKELLRSGREPLDRGERMILNNYRGMQFMREAGTELTPDLVLALHRILVEGTLDDPGAAGRLQRPGEERVIVEDRTGRKVVHTPPPAEQLPARLDAMCAFANDPGDDGPFIHPVLRAIVLHFWLAYDHPFEDGNGRTARTLFYWYLRTRGYWLAEYLSISRILHNAPGQYMRAYLLTETDDGDVTYFLVHQLQVIERAIDELHDYLTRKIAEMRAVERSLRETNDLNHRQVALLSHASRHPDHVYTLRGHAASHGVTHESARTDVAELVERGLLQRLGSRRPYTYGAAADLAQRLRMP